MIKVLFICHGKASPKRQRTSIYNGFIRLSRWISHTFPTIMSLWHSTNDFPLTLCRWDFLYQRRSEVQACLRPWRPLTISERALGHFWWFVRNWRRSKMTGFRFSQYQRNIQIFSVHCLEKYRWKYLGKLFLETIQ